MLQDGLAGLLDDGGVGAEAGSDSECGCARKSQIIEH